MVKLFPTLDALRDSMTVASTHLHQGDMGIMVGTKPVHVTSINVNRLANGKITFAVHCTTLPTQGKLAL